MSLLIRGHHQKNLVGNMFQILSDTINHPNQSVWETPTEISLFASFPPPAFPTLRCLLMPPQAVSCTSCLAPGRARSGSSARGLRRSASTRFGRCFATCLSVCNATVFEVTGLGTRSRGWSVHHQLLGCRVDWSFEIPQRRRPNPNFLSKSPTPSATNHARPPIYTRSLFSCVM